MQHFQKTPKCMLPLLQICVASQLIYSGCFSHDSRPCDRPANRRDLEGHGASPGGVHAPGQRSIAEPVSRRREEAAPPTSSQQTAPSDGSGGQVGGLTARQSTSTPDGPGTEARDCPTQLGNGQELCSVLPARDCQGMSGNESPEPWTTRYVLQLEPPTWSYLQWNSSAQALKNSEQEPLLHETALDTFRELSSVTAEPGSARKPVEWSNQMMPASVQACQGRPTFPWRRMKKDEPSRGHLKGDYKSLRAIEDKCDCSILGKALVRL